MIDLTVPVDTMSLFNFKQYVYKNGKEKFRYIFFDNFEYISKLHQSGKIRNVTFDNIQKTILCSSIYLGYDLFECPDCNKCGAVASQQRAATVSTMIKRIIRLKIFHI